MTPRTVWIAAALFVLGLAVGFGIARTRGSDVAASPPSSVESARPAALADRPPIDGAPEPAAPRPLDAGAPCEEKEAALIKRIARLSRRAELQRKEMAEISMEAYGTPMDWPADPPSEFAADGFEQTLREAIESCAIPYEVVEVECAEPPCVALLRSLGPGADFHAIAACPAWNEVYGHAFSGVEGHDIECGDGSSERVAFLMSPWVGFYESMSTEQKENWHKRNRFRQREYDDRWVCRTEGEPAD